MTFLNFNDQNELIETIQLRLHQSARRKKIVTDSREDVGKISSVLFLLGQCDNKNGKSSEPCVIMNLRSARVRQAGDVCCPGGGLTLPFDQLTAHLLSLPLFSLTKWPFWSWWQNHFPRQTKHLALYYAAALREGLEEMRLNPLGLTFLGVLPPQRLVMFKRVIYAHVAWINHQRRFFPNWEVERIIYIPLTEFLNPANYARYRLQMSFRQKGHPKPRQTNDFLCYAHRHQNGTDILWGATFRIAMDFLNIVFGFNPPQPTTLPVINGRIDDEYLGSSR